MRTRETDLGGGSVRGTKWHWMTTFRARSSIAPLAVLSRRTERMRPHGARNFREWLVACWRKQLDLKRGWIPAVGPQEGHADRLFQTGARRAQMLGKRLALPLHKRAVEELERRKRRRRFGAHRSQLRGVGRVEGIEEWVGQRAEAKPV